MAETVQNLRLGQMLRLYRTVRKLNMRDVAGEIGISASSLCRIENGKSCDMRSLGKLYAWMIGEERP